MPQLTPKPKILVILGPTGSGKSELAVQLAKQFDGEVISADSRQVYRELSIGTNKFTKKEMQGVPHHCIDLASVRRAYGAAQWVKCAEKAIRSCLRRGKLPIIAGGTGYYIDILLGATPLPEVKPNRPLRRELEKLTNEQLLARLKTLDPRRASTIEPDHGRRLIRAIEIATELGAVPEPVTSESPYDALVIGLKVDLEDHVEKLKRYDWFKRGYVAEVKRVKALVSDKRMQELGFEYTVINDYLNKKISKEEAQEVLVRERLKYVKRQMRWFKRNKKIHWHSKDDMQIIVHAVSDFLL